MNRTKSHPIRPDENPFSLGKNPEGLTEEQQEGVPLPSFFISTNNIAVLQKKKLGFETTFRAKVG